MKNWASSNQKWNIHKILYRYVIVVRDIYKWNACIGNIWKKSNTVSQRWMSSSCCSNCASNSFCLSFSIRNAWAASKRSSWFGTLSNRDCVRSIRFFTGGGALRVYEQKQGKNLRDAFKNNSKFIIPSEFEIVSVYAFTLYTILVYVYINKYNSGTFVQT